MRSDSMWFYVVIVSECCEDKTYHTRKYIDYWLFEDALWSQSTYSQFALIRFQGWGGRCYKFLINLPFMEGGLPMLVSESGQNQNCNFPILTVRIGRRIRKTQAKIGTAIPILDRFRSDSDALVLEHQIRLVSDSETMMGRVPCRLTFVPNTKEMAAPWAQSGAANRLLSVCQRFDTLRHYAWTCRYWYAAWRTHLVMFCVQQHKFWFH